MIDGIYPHPTIRLVRASEALSAFERLNQQRQGERLTEVERQALQSDSPFTWGMLMQQDGHHVASLLVRTAPEDQTTAFLFGFTLPEGKQALAIGSALLQHAVQHADMQGIRHFRYAITAGNPQGDTLYRVFAQRSWQPVRETVQYTWPGGSPPEQTVRLTYRSLGEVGTDLFTTAIEDSLQGTLDRVDQREVERVGPGVRAKDLYQILQGISAPAEWWNLAYDVHGKLVGLIVVNQLGDDLGTVGYLAVLPSERGLGYGLDLLIFGTRTLLVAGLSQILLDTDVTNVPTQHLNEGAGYLRRGVARRYAVDLTPHVEVEGTSSTPSRR